MLNSVQPNSVATELSHRYTLDYIEDKLGKVTSEITNHSLELRRVFD